MRSGGGMEGEAGGFAEAVGENLKVLSREGLDKKLFEKVLKALGWK